MFFACKVNVIKIANGETVVLLTRSLHLSNKGQSVR